MVKQIILGLVVSAFSITSAAGSDRVIPAGMYREIAVVSNSVEGTVSLLDIVTMGVVKTINVIPDGPNASFLESPYQYFSQPKIEAAGGLNYAQDTDVSPDGNTLYVSRGHRGDVVAIDIASGKIKWKTGVRGVRADHMDISNDGTTLFVSAMVKSGNTVEAIATKDGKKMIAYDAGNWPHDVHVIGQKVYFSSLGNMQVDLEQRNLDANSYLLRAIDINSGELLMSHSFDHGIRPFVIDSKESFVIAQLSNTHDLEKRDLAAGEIITRNTLPVSEGVNESDWDFEAPHHGLAMTSDDNTLCVAGRASDYAGIVDVETLQKIKTVPVGNAPSWSVIDSSNQFCILANNRSDDVSIVDINTATEISRIPVGRGPKHITIAYIRVKALQ